jgi:hypothetical protein
MSVSLSYYLQLCCSILRHTDVAQGRSKTYVAPDERSKRVLDFFESRRATERTSCGMTIEDLSCGEED